MHHSSDEKKKPFLYIQQPYIKVDEANNQEVFILRAKKEKVVKKEVLKEVGINFEMFEEVVDHHYPVEKLMDGKEVLEFTKSKANFNRRKPFKELTIHEKIQYIDNYPTQLPPIACYYRLSEEIVQGKLLGSNDTHIKVQLEDGQEKIISMENILEITLPGLG